MEKEDQYQWNLLSGVHQNQQKIVFFCYIRIAMVTCEQDVFFQQKMFFRTIIDDRYHN